MPKIVKLNDGGGPPIENILVNFVVNENCHLHIQLLRGSVEEKGLGLTPGLSRGLTTLRTEAVGASTVLESSLWWEGAQCV